MALLHSMPGWLSNSRAPPCSNSLVSCVSLPSQCHRYALWTAIRGQQHNRRIPRLPQQQQQRRQLRVVALDKLYTSASPVEADKYSYLVQGGGRLVAEVRRMRNTYDVTFILEGVGLQSYEAPFLHWGAYRSSPSKWFHPPKMVSQDSVKHDSTGAMRSPMFLSVTPSDARVLTVKLEVPEELVPVMVGCLVWIENTKGGPMRGRYLAPMRGQTFTIPVGMGTGFCSPLGPSVVTPMDPAQETYCINFAVVSRNAASMSLCLARAADGPGSSASSYLEVALDPVVNRTGDVWHIMLEGLRKVESLAYGWRAGGDTIWSNGNHFAPGLVLLDPFAPLVTSAVLPEGAHVPPMETGRQPLNGLMNGEAVLGSLACLHDSANEPELGESPFSDLEDVVVLELDVSTFTAGLTQVPSHLQGTFLGLLERVDYIKAIGANALLLRPVYATHVGRHNGSAPLTWFAPASRYASDPRDPLSAHRDLRTLINALHETDIEVWVQMEFCQTAEGVDDSASPISLRGLDSSLYYRQGVLNTGHAYTWPLVIGAMEHWVDTYGVDGICLQSAETMCLDRDGNIIDNPWVPEALAYHPTLRHVKLIAAHGSDTLLPRGGERGFPHWGVWMERNRRFADDMRQYMVHASSGMASVIATRITGSPDLLAARWDGTLPGSLAAGRRPAYGINGVAALGRTTLTDGVTETASQTSLSKALLVAVLMAQGVPCITEDAVQDAEFARFVGITTRVRQRYLDLLQPIAFDSPRDIRWHGAGPGSEPDWGAIASPLDPMGKIMGYSIRQADGRGIFVCFNPNNTAAAIALPEPVPGTIWGRVIDTAKEAPEDALIRDVDPVIGTSIAMGPQSAIVLEAIPPTQ